MEPAIQEKIRKIFSDQKRLSEVDLDFEDSTSRTSKQVHLKIQEELALLPELQQRRIRSELESYGPLDELLNDPEITEILVNRFDEIFFEKLGKLHRWDDHFFSEQTYTACLDRLSQLCHCYLNRDKPFVESQLGLWRITILFSELSRGSNLLSIRKQPHEVWTLQRLQDQQWCTKAQMELIKNIFASKENFLVIGSTGSGKTSYLQALLQQFSKTERAVIIEDTQELLLPNSASCSLLTRQDPSGCVRDVTMDDLLKRALRLRPDRLVIGEIRGPEAKSLLMALATGHDGSFGSMHARTASEALLRLEMLIQMGAPQWNLKSIRHLIAMTLQYIFVVEKVDGKRKLQGIYQISSLEENGIILQKADD